ncbi:MAG TPA: DoxX family protein [Bryobacteraceae bacterium]|nr:DoxX family protein [Bryobacteraceae bacterium]
MSRTIAYWGSTGVVSVMLMMSLMYLTGSEQVVAGFAKAGYPQHLRVVLGIAKPLAGVVLLAPGLALVKEWAYACVTFTWLMASLSANLSGEPPQVWMMPIALLALLAVSYVTRPASRRIRMLASA